jgi:hypothetical protein
MDDPAAVFGQVFQKRNAALNFFRRVRCIIAVVHCQIPEKSRKRAGVNKIPLFGNESKEGNFIDRVDYDLAAGVGDFILAL